LHFLFIPTNNTNVILTILCCLFGHLKTKTVTSSSYDNPRSTTIWDVLSSVKLIKPIFALAATSETMLPQAREHIPNEEEHFKGTQQENNYE
jgi:hypothetical protein